MPGIRWEGQVCRPELWARLVAGALGGLPVLGCTLPFLGLQTLREGSQVLVPLPALGETRKDPLVASLVTSLVIQVSKPPKCS